MSRLLPRLPSPTLRLALLLAAALLLLAAPASAVTIAYEISSSGELGEFPFSGIFAERDDDDRKKHDDDDDGRKKHRDDHHKYDRDDDRKKHEKAHSNGKGKKKGHYRHHDDHSHDHEKHHGEGWGDDEDRDDKGDVAILSDDLRGLIALSTQDDSLFLDDQELTVEEFTLMGTLAFCQDCEELAITIELDPDSRSVLEVDDGSLEGEIDLLVTVDGERKSLTLRVEGETEDPEWNFATPDVLSLLLELEIDDDHDWGGHFGSCGGGSGHRDYDRKGSYDRKDDCDRKGDVFLKAQGVVPEPGTALLLGSGLLSLVVWRRRRR